MNLWLRLLRVVLTARRRGPVTPLEPGSIRVRVWPHDLDLWGHVNGGRSLYDPVGPRTPRSVHSQRLDGFGALNRWVLPIGSAVVRFRRPLRLFQTCDSKSWESRLQLDVPNMSLTAAMWGAVFAFAPYLFSGMSVSSVHVSACCGTVVPGEVRQSEGDMCSSALS